MITMRWPIDKTNPQPELLNKAADLLKSGELVAFPTETVYGLGADAYNAPAVKKIFEVKGRMPQSPLLVHVSNYSQVEDLVAGIPSRARQLMEQFWPGPLAVILSASNRVPDEVLGGNTTVGLRMPAHPVALALIEAAGPIAAPSANLSGRPSPVSAQHVLDDLGGRIAAILDAGPTGLGLESTILDLSRSVPEILRLGGVPAEQLEAALGCNLKVASGYKTAYHTGEMKIILCEDEEQWLSLAALAESERVALVHYGRIPGPSMDANKKAYTLSLGGQGPDLFTIIREAETRGYKQLIFAPLPSTLSGLGSALANRIRRAAGS
jgi:L-threonylcarbamoyladenylate synthase